MEATREHFGQVVRRADGMLVDSAFARALIRVQRQQHSFLPVPQFRVRRSNLTQRLHAVLTSSRIAFIDGTSRLVRWTRMSSPKLITSADLTLILPGGCQPAR